MFRFLALLLLLPGAVMACSMCGCGDPLDAAGQSLPMAGQWRLGMEWNSFGAQAASDDSPDKRDSLQQLQLAASVAYAPRPDLSLFARLPWNQKTFLTISATDSPDGGISSGLGDMELAGRWFFASSVDVAARSRSFAALTLGSTLNTGPNNLQNGGQRLDEHDQPGSGAVGPYAGILLGAGWNGLALSLHAGGYKHATNASGYTYGQALKAGLNLRSDMGESAALGLGLEGRYADYDRSNGDLIVNSGGTLLELAPSLNFRIGQAIGLGLKALVPVFSSLFGDQRVDTSFSISLQLIL